MNFGSTAVRRTCSHVGVTHTHTHSHTQPLVILCLFPEFSFLSTFCLGVLFSFLTHCLENRSFFFAPLNTSPLFAIAPVLFESTVLLSFSSLFVHGTHQTLEKSAWENGVRAIKNARGHREKNYVSRRRQRIVLARDGTWSEKKCTKAFRHFTVEMDVIMLFFVK